MLPRRMNAFDGAESALLFHVKRGDVSGTSEVEKHPWNFFVVATQLVIGYTKAK